MLLYADDIALIAPDAEKLQKQLDILNKWCEKWRLTLNKNKTKIVHFRNKSVLRSNSQFKCGELCLEYAACYKYLGVLLNEFSDYSIIAKEL